MSGYKDLEPESSALWSGQVGTAGTLQDGTLRVYVDFEPEQLGSVATHIGTPGTPVAISSASGIYSLSGVSRGIRKTFQDGTVRVSLDIDAQDHWRAWAVVGKPQDTVIVAALRCETQRHAGHAPYSEYAQALWQSRFFQRRRVWLALGGTSRYEAFLLGRPCAQPGGVHNGEVRTLILTGSDGWRLPLCAKHSAYGNDPARWPGGWPQARRLLDMHYSAWAHQELADAIGHPRLRETPPALIQSWARDHGVADLLPDVPEDGAIIAS